MADTKPTSDQDNTKQQGEINRLERTDADFTAVGRWMVIIVGFLLVTAWASWQYFQLAWQRAEEGGGRRSPLAVPDKPIQEIEGPKLQVSPPVTMKQFAKEQDETLNHYGWISKEAGAVRLPIEAAIAKAATTGTLVSRENVESTATVPDDGVSYPQDSSGGRTYWNVAR